MSLSGKRRERVGVCGEVQSWLLVGNPAHQVKTVDNKLLVHAKHEESTGGRCSTHNVPNITVLYPTNQIFLVKL